MQLPNVCLLRFKTQRKQTLGCHPEESSKEFGQIKIRDNLKAKLKSQTIRIITHQKLDTWSRHVNDPNRCAGRVYGRVISRVHGLVLNRTCVTIIHWITDCLRVFEAK